MAGFMPVPCPDGPEFSSDFSEIVAPQVYEVIAY